MFEASCSGLTWPSLRLLTGLSCLGSEAVHLHSIGKRLKKEKKDRSMDGWFEVELLCPARAINSAAFVVPTQLASTGHFIKTATGC